nr:MAG TPA: hypothetical protein [Caudoviricetes sp.]
MSLKRRLLYLLSYWRLFSSGLHGFPTYFNSVGNSH